MRLLVAVVFACAACRTPPPQPEAPEPPTGAPVRVMSYNANYGAVGAAASMRAIDDGDADIVLLQETTDDWQAVLEGSFGDRYLHRSFHPCCGAGGLAVLSRFPLRRVEMLPAVSWFPAMRVDIDTPDGPLQILNVHLRPPLEPAAGRSLASAAVVGHFTTSNVRASEMATFTKELRPGVATVIVGDFNEDHGDATEHLASRGFVDALARFAPETHTWAWDVGPVSIEERLDHCFYDPASVLVVAAGVAPETGSDHFATQMIIYLERK
jgi:endonuclease/exonuclease/phosphatase family metal-dependent hydrolase